MYVHVVHNSIVRSVFICSDMETEQFKSIGENAVPNTVESSVPHYLRYLGLSSIDDLFHDSDSEANLQSNAVTTEKIDISSEESTSELTTDQIWNRYKDNVIIDGKLVLANSEAIKEIAERTKKTQKAVRLLLQRKFKATTSDDLKKKEKRNLRDETSVVKADELDRDTQNVDKSHPPPDKITESLSQTYDISAESIFEIETRQRMHRGKSVKSRLVKFGWSGPLTAFLWKKTDLDCKFDLRVAYITKNEVIKTTGACGCGAILGIACRENNLDVDIKNIDKSFKHERRYQVTGERRKSIAEQLMHDSALKVRTKTINELVPDNVTLRTNHIPLLPTANTYRKIKSEMNENRDPIDTLLDWKDSIYTNVISLVSVSPLTIHYRTAIQLAYYVAERKKHRMCVSIDATGSLVKPPRNSQEIDGKIKLKHVFLYTIMAKNNSKSVAVAQMITQDQSSEKIEFFLKKMYKQIEPPHEFVCDESKATLKAIASAFAHYDGIESYINQCLISLETCTAPPKCQIRLDRSHFIKNVTRKIKYGDFRKRIFYRCIFGFLIKCDKFDVVKEVVRDLFTVLRNENDGTDEFGEILPAELSKVRLINLVGTHDDTVDYYENEMSNWNDDMNFRSSTKCRISTKWIHDIIENVRVKNVNGGHLNIYFDTEGEKDYIQMLSTIPLWSNIMNESFRSTSAVATSSDVESSFNSLKNGIVAGNIMQVHTFLQLHIDFVNAEIKLNAVSNMNPSMTPKRSRSLESTPKRLQERTLSLCDSSPMRIDPIVLGGISDNDGKHLIIFFGMEETITTIHIVRSSRRRELAQQEPSNQNRQ